jgi:Uma2 family endonuclease
MSTAVAEIASLVAGDKLTRDEFLRRWEAMPDVKRAELIGGVVYMPSSVSLEHGYMTNDVGHWLGHYVLQTPGCRAGQNATWLMLADAPQPDVHLCLLPKHGGQSRVKGQFHSGAPELVADVCLSTTAYDLHQKLELYLAAGVQEYVAVLLREREVRWHRRIGGTFELLPESDAGIIQSVAFPGLWLNVPALLDENMASVLKTLNEGIQSREHAEFVARLSRQP